ncbi:tRNA (N6-isopentenyl adenosine(37)-C2)-methylthiotransferase MiaB [Candidatus Pantoea edessiphila]|uniref:tRNA-2-methylthio-N(6)-dimethylallyladenosine synthase n=1 Tax=Candidatus Pantoea edessiphila TaxID=2044610 RepID=A0A2P5T2A0_9GAMM|nr:tRNA (N6-isopentenyl adenosine(37)-C2)-methylthiotransferase MiaB [Candidatus Pantoea edessiphila]PPI88721.1 tRNA (N6-isopentenyl adenosine(37)-C2)-methylthiotransferase MiaB [Candidatus Pantoea edessiphila]
MKKIYIKTWGCQMNEYDSSKIINLLKQSHGYILTKEAENADILLLNTCSVREKAQEKVFHQLGRWKNFKKNNTDLIIGVGGCVASQEGEYIIERAPYVDIVFGPQTLHRLPEMINRSYNIKNPIIDISFPKLEKFDRFSSAIADKPTAFVSIMEGCNKYCTFCIVPYTRGEEVSRSSNEILLEISQLASQGVREITLLGQNVNAYRGLNSEGQICTLANLLRLVAKIQGIDRIRFITSHPIEFNDELIEVYKDIPNLVSFLHLPVQSGSDRILKLMKRSHTALDYKSIINKLIQVRPNIQISSDFIVGFPGETVCDFNETINFIKDINFDMSFSFLYSPRPGTPATYLPDEVKEEEKKRRLYLLQDLINKQAKYWSDRMVGTIQRVLVDGFSRTDTKEISGKTENNRVVTFKGSYNNIGKFVDVRITGNNFNYLKGKLLKTEDEINFS